MQLFSVSIREIEIDLINYFRSSFPADSAPIFPETDVRRRYRYTPEAWAELADELSTVPWVIHLGAVLIQDDMRGVSTIAQLASLIFKHIRHVVAPKTRLEVTSLTTLMRSPYVIDPAVSRSPTTTSRRAKGTVKKNQKEGRQSEASIQVRSVTMSSHSKAAIVAFLLAALLPSVAFAIRGDVCRYGDKDGNLKPSEVRVFVMHQQNEIYRKYDVNCDGRLSRTKRR